MKSFFMNYQNEIASIMSKYLGVVRNKADLEFALQRLKNLQMNSVILITNTIN